MPTTGKSAVNVGAQRAVDAPVDVVVNHQPDGSGSHGVRAFSANVQATGKPGGAPRDTSAMFPAGNPAKSAALQPRKSRRDGTADCCRYVSTAGVGHDVVRQRSGRGGATCSSTDGDNETKVWNWNAWVLTLHPALVRRFLTYSTDLSYPGEPETRVLPLALAMALERRLVLANSCESDALLQQGGGVVGARATADRGRRDGVHRGDAARDDEGSGCGDGEGRTMYSGIHRGVLSSDMARVRGASSNQGAPPTGTHERRCSGSADRSVPGRFLKEEPKEL